MVVSSAERSAVVEWLERLGYDAEIRRKVVSSRLGLVMRRWKTLSSQQKMGIFFQLGKDMVAKEDGWAPPFINCALDTVGL